MKPDIKAVSIGLILGTLGLLFGIFWAMYLVVNHENIHKQLSDAAKGSLIQTFVINEPASGHDHHASHGQTHTEPAKEEAKPAQDHSGHDDPAMEAAHERLTRGHLHAMGLGTITVLFSFLLSFLSAPPKVKAIASACIGIGALFYPLAWIVMGFRTTAMGVSAAQESVLPIVALSVPLVLFGLLITLFFIVKGFLSKG